MERFFFASKIFYSVLHLLKPKAVSDSASLSNWVWICRLWIPALKSERQEQSMFKACWSYRRMQMQPGQLSKTMLQNKDEERAGHCCKAELIQVRPFQSPG